MLPNKAKSKKIEISKGDYHVYECWQNDGLLISLPDGNFSISSVYVDSSRAYATLVEDLSLKLPPKRKLPSVIHLDSDIDTIIDHLECIGVNVSSLLMDHLVSINERLK